ncbi:MAG: hypothetical protein K0S27_1490 [Gammaproteobacteria bacterium]|jgi:hypothetical protein|nr:hypothetical protein [Gammaproteobacteria bacterium]
MKISPTLKTSLAFIASAVSAAATFPYGYRFATLFHLSSPALHLSFAYLLGGTAYLANMVLGAYSLLDIKKEKRSQNIFVILILSIFGAVPMGFFSYAGYKSFLPISLNILTSLIVIIVNTGINYTAIFNLVKSTKEFLKKRGGQKISWARFLLCTAGGIIGALVSLTAYLATTNGLTNIFLHYDWTPALALQIAAILAIIIWLPFGALYVNSVQVVVGNIYHFFSTKKDLFKEIKLYDMALILFVLLAGSAFAQMALDFYSPHNLIPHFFKLPFVQVIAYYGLMPLALLSSAAVNYFALIKVIEYIKNK